MREEANSNVKGRTPLMLAAFKGDLPAVRRLLAEGADVNARDEVGDTALMFAAFRGHEAIVNLLLSRGANVHARARNGWTARKAAERGFNTAIAVTLRRAEMEGALPFRSLHAVG
ncbi:MAG TPA: ankyrin repeat domain-containing protein [Pyrinomonadaceae bacterium]|nr:ankyrin repeat domain-containing protein [Pyrinomonadaceae bacterium]